MLYTIGDFSKATGISIHTLRYYEKEGLIVPARTESGRRFYSDRDFYWITEVIRRMKDTGMPIKDIRTYAGLRAQGDATMRERVAMLRAHRAVLVERIALFQEHLENLDVKIRRGEAVIARQGAEAAETEAGS